MMHSLTRPSAIALALVTAVAACGTANAVERRQERTLGQIVLEPREPRNPYPADLYSPPVYIGERLDTEEVSTPLPAYGPATPIPYCSPSSPVCP